MQNEQAQASLSAELRSREEFELRLEMFVAQLLDTYLRNRETLLTGRTISKARDSLN